MPPVMLHISSPTVTICAWDGVAVPTFAYPHEASSCPLVSASVSRKSLAVNITASQVTECGRFYTSYEVSLEQRFQRPAKEAFSQQVF